jgi:hypothetical protein
MLVFSLSRAQTLAPASTDALCTLFDRYAPILWIIALVFAAAFYAVLRIDQPVQQVVSIS